MQALVKPVAVALLLIGCTASTLLSRQIGDGVELSGRLSGPGKEGLYVLVSAEPVYLPGYAGPIPVGTSVLVQGKLQWVSSASDCLGDSECANAARSAHYFIDGARVTVAH